MMGIVRVLCFGVVLACFAPEGLAAQAKGGAARPGGDGYRSATAPRPRSALLGVYTEAQAARGNKVQMESCSACHSARDEWTRAAFIGAWSGRPARDLFEYLRETMPMDMPGSLSRQQYADVVAYILKLNGLPAGTAELKSDDASLRQVLIERKKK